MDIQLYGNGILVSEKKRLEFLSLKVTPSFLCVLVDSIEKGKLSAVECIKYYAVRLTSEYNLYAFCRCLTLETSNVYLDNKIHIVAYLLQEPDDLKRVAALCCIKVGSDLSLSVEKNDIKMESVNEWLKKRKYSIEETEDEKKIVSILTGIPSGIKLSEYETRIVISCRSCNAMVQKYLSPLQSKVMLDYIILLQATKDYNSCVFEYYISNGAEVSYLLLCTLVSLLDEKNPVLTREIETMLLDCARYCTFFDLYLFEEIKKRDLSLYNKMVKEYSIPLIDKLNSITLLERIPKKLLFTAKELNLDSSSFSSLMKDLNKVLDLGVEEQIRKRESIAKIKYSIGRTKLDDITVDFSLLKDYRVLYRKDNSLRMVPVHDVLSVTDPLILKKVVKKISSIHDRMQDSFIPLTLYDLFSSLTDPSVITNDDTEGRVRTMIEKVGRFPETISNDIFGSYILPSQITSLNALAYLVTEEWDGANNVVSKLFEK